MASTLSPSAIHRIIVCLDSDDCPVVAETERGAAHILAFPTSRYVLTNVNSTWKAVYKLYRDVGPQPPIDYLNSLELALGLKGRVTDEDVRAIFAYGKPLEFWGCTFQLVSKIVEVRRRLSGYLSQQ